VKNLFKSLFDWTREVWRKSSGADAEHRKSILATLVICAAAAMFVVLFFVAPTYRPLLIVAVAAVGALLPVVIPELVKASPFAGWLAAIVAAVCVAVGTLYTVAEFNRKADEQERKVDNYHELLLSLKELPPAAREPLILSLAVKMRHAYGEHRPDRYDNISDIADILLSYDPENGHGPYYKGETYRVARQFENMRGMFNRYLATADSTPGAFEGLATEGYKRPNGYCGERTAYIRAPDGQRRLSEGAAQPGQQWV
jgi:hypothetical protein